MTENRKLSECIARRYQVMFYNKWCVCVCVSLCTGLWYEMYFLLWVMVKNI